MDGSGSRRFGGSSSPIVPARTSSALLLLGLAEEFARLHRLYGTVRARLKPDFYARNVELYHWAQVIGALQAPRVQQELDACRRQVMNIIVEQEHGALRHDDGVFAPALDRTRWTWMDYQITPEVSHDPALLGRICDKRLVKRLQQALHLQIKAVRFATGI